MAEQCFKQAFRRASTSASSHDLVEKSKFNDGTKLTDLNPDCLYSIFKLLPLNDAIKMCNVSKTFVEPVNWIVALLNSKNTFEVLGDCWDSFQRSHQIYIRTVQIKYISQSLSKVLIDYRQISRTSRYVVDTVLEYCTQLTELKLVNFEVTRFESIKKPIAKLEVLHLDNCVLEPAFCQFSKWLPRLRSLTVTKCKVIDESCIHNMGTKMQALESIHLDDVRKPIIKLGMTTYHLCNVDEIIKRNGHAKCFRSLSDMKPRRLLNISKAMDRLETLDLRIQKMHFKGSSYTSIGFKWVKKLVLKISGGESIQCPLAFEMLEELDISCDHFDKTWLFFARSNKLKKLRFTTKFQRLDQVLTISSTWPSLIEVSMELYVFEAREIVTFINSFTNLQRFNFPMVWPDFLYFEFSKYEEVKRDLSDQYEVLPGTDEYRFSLVRLKF